ncbi:hypothetical protein JCGZ_15334 [Jatropha curcas]|uniref:Class II aldolase/adducin N-terminal domain-containing protein n=1 Tax=Jatropha curcas TaxID=180498 RepID=A0A067LM70_JATCU|nr:hypothetical protein JCGZ_15334 [Jatropha curcas]
MAAPAAATAVAVNGAVKVASQAYLESKAVKDTRVLISDLCRQFYNLGWVSGTGGSITIKVHDDSIPKSQQLVLMSPSVNYQVTVTAYEMRNAGAVIHSHGIESCLVTMINPLSKEFRITHMEMIKGIQGHGYYDELVVPIIENTAYENQLTDSLAKAIEAYPKTTAVLVRNHGIYIWGESWISAKTQAECYHYLFDAAIKLHQLGLDWSTPEHGPVQNVKGILGSNRNINTSVKATVKDSNDIGALPRCIVLDIEGTTTPISFVADVLFPYARDNVGRHLTTTYETVETQDDIKLLRSQVEEDLAQGVNGSVPIPPDDAGKEEVVAALVANVEAMIRADRKITALKQLQGHIWRTGFENNELEGVVFDDVPEALEKWHCLGVKVILLFFIILFCFHLCDSVMSKPLFGVNLSSYLDYSSKHSTQLYEWIQE